MTVNEFDHVVVGGGSAGCVLAARLSEDPSVSVCLLEAGPSDVGDPSVLQLDRWPELLASGHDWDYAIEPQERGNGFVRHARANVLGGCSSHNSCIAFWPPREDLDEWASFGCDGWSADACWPLVRRLETNDGPRTGHGRSGPVTLMQIPPADPCGVAALAAAASAGLPRVRFKEGDTICEGRRVLPDQPRARRHARVVVARVPAPDHGVAAEPGDPHGGVGGAGAVRGPAGDRRRVPAGHRARPSRGAGPVGGAGAIDTPKLLMLSGIGPAGHLRAVGVDVRVDAPGGGANLDDHVEGLVMWEAARPMVTRSTQWWEIGLFTRTEAGLDRPERFVHEFPSR